MAGVQFGPAIRAVQSARQEEYRECVDDPLDMTRLHDYYSLRTGDFSRLFAIPGPFCTSRRVRVTTRRLPSTTLRKSLKS